MDMRMRARKMPENFTDYSRLVWGMLIRVGQQIPHGHRAQQRLIDLVRELKLLPKTSDEVMRPTLPTLKRILVENCRLANVVNSR